SRSARGTGPDWDRFTASSLSSEGTQMDRVSRSAPGSRVLTLVALIARSRPDHRLGLPHVCTPVTADPGTVPQQVVRIGAGCTKCRTLPVILVRRVDAAFG